MIVVGASAAVLGLLHGTDARHVLATRALVAPHLIDCEVAQALRGLVLRKRLPADDARSALIRWARLGVRRFGAPGLLPRVWELREDLTAYDATYVALAEALSCELVTADARLAAAPGPRCPMVVVRR